MRILAAAALVLALASAAPAAAQVSEARVRAAIDDAARGLGQAVGGGSPLVGPSAATGGLGHFELGIGGTLTGLEIEDPTRSEGTVDFLLPTGTVHGAIGITGGGPRGFGAIDLIGRFGAVVAREDVEEGAPIVGLGVRVGILEEGALFPAVSVTAYGSRVDGLAWGDPDGDDVSFDADVSTLSLRADVSKSFLVATPYAGVGLDRASIDARYRIPPESSTGGSEIRGELDAASVHPKAYAGVRLGLLLLDAALEVGAYDGGTFGAVGVRLAH